ncbi:MAG: Maf family protein, partial [Bacteroidaceae bacterium]
MTLKNISQYTIILASNSPRRKELLQSLGFAFEIRTINDVDESYPEGLSERNI